jgi:hypothetical protein
MKLAGDGGTVGGLAWERQTQAAGIGGEGVIEQKKAPTQVGLAVDQGDVHSPLGQVMGSRHPSQAGADDENGRLEALPHSTASNIAST